MGKEDVVCCGRVGGVDMGYEVGGGWVAGNSGGGGGGVNGNGSGSGNGNGILSGIEAYSGSVGAGSGLSYTHSPMKSYRGIT